MEMWCPDDIGRDSWDSWDWVGPPAWVRACDNSPEWCGGSSPVKKRSLPRLYYCCCCGGGGVAVAVAVVVRCCVRGRGVCVRCGVCGMAR